jgi:hypothetical protein
MNWRFTRRGHWVRFEENEPFCFFFPVARAALEGVEPRMRPMADEPGLAEQFESWSRSRDAFQAWVEQTHPQAPADKWQKLYYRGVQPDGTPGPADHVSKLRLPPFPPQQCPAGKAASPDAAPADPLVNPGLALTLGRLGFPPKS